MRFFQMCSLMIFLFALCACQKKSVDVVKNLEIDIPESKEFVITQDYIDEMELWKKKRFKSVTSPYGWLSVIGLHWLKEGENRMGSGSENDIVLPEMASPYLGSIFLLDGKMNFSSYPESYVSLGDNNRFDKGMLLSDADGEATVLNHHSLYFHVIKRGQKYGLRLKNTLAPARFELKKIPHFELNADMIFDGVVLPTSSQDSIEIQDVLGEIKMYHLESKLAFRYQGKVHELLAIDGGPDKYFVIFADESSGEETYGGGRFLYVHKPYGDSNRVQLDFNKSENPPCIFTDFATCPLPPDENKLKFSVNAGEKKLKSH